MQLVRYFAGRLSIVLGVRELDGRQTAQTVAVPIVGPQVFVLLTTLIAHRLAGCRLVRAGRHPMRGDVVACGGAHWSAGAH